jgi:hypothetical protein
VDLHVFGADGRHVGPNPATGEYDMQIEGAHAGGIGTSSQWISIPDDVPATVVVDASKLVASAAALGLPLPELSATVSFTHYDAAGNASDSAPAFEFRPTSTQPASTARQFGPPANSDAIAPTSQVTFTPTPNPAGWNNSDVTVTVAAVDNPGGSGVKQITVSAAGAMPFSSNDFAGSSASIAVTAEGVTTLTFFSTDVAGNTEVAKTVTIWLDTTPPVVRCGKADGVWHASDVAIGCTASDDLSGLASPADASFSLSTGVAAGTETAIAATGAHTISDLAQNRATAGPIGGNMIDRKPPQITISGPVAANYIVNEIVAANYSCGDLGSGVAICAGPVANAANLSTASAGSWALQVNATDRVGNASAASVAYTVSYKTCLLYDSSKAKTRGSTYPIKLRLCDVSDNNLSSAAISVRAVSETMASTDAPGALDASGNANPDDNFRYDPSLGGYIFNLNTSGLGSGTYNLNFSAGSDPVLHSVSFQIK